MRNILSVQSVIAAIVLTLFAISLLWHPGETAGWHERETRGVTASGLDATIFGTAYPPFGACDTQASDDNAASIAAAKVSSTPLDVLRFYDCVFDPGKVANTRGSLIVASRALAGHFPPAASAIASGGSPSPKVPLPTPCMKSGVDLATLPEFTPTPTQLIVYRNSYRSEVVRGIRSALDKYVEGTADEETRDSLKPYGPKFGRDRFVLFSADRSVVGGWFVRLQFRHSMDSIYQVWLYRLGGVEPILRNVSKVPCAADQIRALNRMSKRFWALPYDG